LINYWKVLFIPGLILYISLLILAMEFYVFWRALYIFALLCSFIIILI